MTFQPGSQDPAGGVLYDDALQLLLTASSTQQYQPETVNYLSEPSSVPCRPLEHDYTRSYPQTFSEHLLPQPPPESGAGQQIASHEILSALDELKQEISLIQTKCDNLAVTFSEFHNGVKTSIDEIKEYVELHRAWSLLFKRAVENQIRDRGRTRDRTSGSEDSSIESQGG